MRVLIDIDEDYYNVIMSIPQTHRRNLKGNKPTELMMSRDIAKQKVINAVKNGTPIPEHCGDLIDRNKLLKQWIFGKPEKEIIANAETVIPAIDE